jgi:hypothetical protein
MKMRTIVARLSLLTATLAFALPALAHNPIDMTGPAPTMDQAFILPSAQDTWNIYGLLQKPGEIGFIRLDDLNPDQAVSLALRVFTKPAYATFTPALALIGPGLPQPGDSLPFALPDGSGAIVATFAGDASNRPVSGSGGVYTWSTDSFEVPNTVDSPAYIAVWDPSGGAGEYNVVFNITPDVDDPNDPDAAKYANPTPGDANDDGKVTVADATVALRMAVGLTPLTPRAVRALDVSPTQPDTTSKLMPGDGKITVADVTRILGRAVGVIGDPFP